MTPQVWTEQVEEEGREGEGMEKAKGDSPFAASP